MRSVEVAVVTLIACCATACGDPLVGTWSQGPERAALSATVMEMAMHLGADGSFAFESQWTELGYGCVTVSTMRGFRWSDDIANRRLTITAGPGAESTYVVSQCNDPRFDMPASVTSNAASPPLTVDYALPSDGLVLTGEIGRVGFHGSILSRHAVP